MKITLDKNPTILRIGCAVLGLLMFFGLFLPAIKFSSPVSIAEEVYRLTSGGYTDSEDQMMFELIDRIYDSGALQKILKRYSGLKLRSLGSKADGYGYFSGALDTTIENLSEQMEYAYLSRIESVIDSLRWSDSSSVSIRRAASQIKDIVSDRTFQKQAANLLFAYTVYGLYEFQDESDMELNMKSTVRVAQTLARCVAAGSLSPVQADRTGFRLSFGLFRILRSSGFSQLEYQLQMLGYGGAVSGVRTAVVMGIIFSILYLLFLLAYAFMTLRIVYGVLVGRQQAVRTSGIIATSLALLEFLVILLLKLLLPALIKNSGMLGSLSMYASLLPIGKLFGYPAFYLYFVILIGVGVCLIAFLFWDVELALPGIGSRTRAPRAKKWTCSCGFSCGADAAFCPACGRKKPVESFVSDAWICPRCGSSQGADSGFCANCGTQKPQVRASLRCSCGAELQPGDMFCPSCGRPTR